ncbi:hypothetical protein LCGC14_3069490, partial [marine sediment metagenome]
SGYRPFENMINMDYDPITYPDVVRDVNRGFPFEENRFKEIYTSHVIEHIDDVFYFMAEIWRVTKDKGKVIIIAPYCGFLDWAIQPDHKRFISYDYFVRWKPSHQSVQNEKKQLLGAEFKTIKIELINEGREIKVELEVVKDV